ncbi:hypothetical protein A3K48_05235 [candidate division WOR-1 bacterium RIFOXYA12_FULL_52_29]|uniref:Uncharacterized protein n=1 Tax=candidate division WOR-1 bacterium RIFOXYC12_FULL_54_18 TaxID=1802584 RepID=A0A1F4T6Y4_UNCSA|nr:MAG: hypothetical protein A3K44_05235 [candidate division WOR-1 bacterium RIFOXYA2_FULL_51_19]OGC17949.1 MAG: hypothetical protein A3K48_05235 [candidate division WOR-1 bacterium RIFOXYA12_FULL_52_29]OGC26806.1 MAG: hypothetical protein A3K32_05230 [candidate division WOR-1 bacterium RIFOXYB2_FULL_45_9]OGC28366.1 MAG: hypothetical protein A3K49_05235 [candidate division WOR-1 bacterium RIFOXYC12_FULL_54_18]OGC31178.1 MAG: hypothetical protein A2346_07385 [candidate division WOR-1 bacterium R
MIKKISGLITCLMVLFSCSSSFALPTVSPAASNISVTTIRYLDVSCFYKNKRIAAQVSVIEIDSGENAISGTGITKWASDGRAKFNLSSGKNYGIFAHEAASSSTVITGTGIQGSKTMPNFWSSTAIGLALDDFESGGLEQSYADEFKPAQEGK